MRTRKPAIEAKGGKAGARGEVRFVARLEESRNRLWGAHIRVPKSVAEKFLRKGSRRVICTLNKSRTYPCALLPRGDGSCLITVNKKLRTDLHLDFGTNLHVHLVNDTSEYGLPMPAELAELLRQDREGRRHFDALTPGRKRTLLYIVGQAKNPERRLLRAVTVVRHLAANNGTINYRGLSAELRKS
ncbi:MAG TPA: YdeI/OmpD-associated family protein [Bacteroidota bacterium]